MADRILFVRSGGGLPGIDIHIGIWRALHDAGIKATHVAGTSAGAIVSAFDSASCTPAHATRIVTGLADPDVRDPRTLWRLRAGFINHIMHGKRVRKMLKTHLPVSWAYYRKPCQTYATRLRDAAAINTFTPGLSRSPAEAVLASVSITAVFPSVRLADGLLYEDGGVRRNLPLPRDWHTYDRVYLLIANGGPSNYTPVKGIISNAIRAYKMLMADQTLDILEQVAGAPNVTVICPQVVTGGTLHFNHDLIKSAQTATEDILNGN